MKNKPFYLFLILLFVFCFAVGAAAEMGSENYRIPTSVISGGGAPMNSASASYQTDSTVGQPSPLMDPANPPWSTNYDLYPGFWYTLEAGTAECTELSCFAATYGLTSADAGYNFACDFDDDGDVDGKDLADFAAEF